MATAAKANKHLATRAARVKMVSQDVIASAVIEGVSMKVLQSGLASSKRAARASSKNRVKSS